MARASSLRHLVDFERLTVVRGSAGGATKGTWGPIEQNVFAEFMPEKGREFFASRGLVNEQNAVFRVRYREDLTAKDRVKFAGAYYNIVSLVNEMGLRRFTLVYCTTGVVAQGA